MPNLQIFGEIFINQHLITHFLRKSNISAECMYIKTLSFAIFDHLLENEMLSYQCKVDRGNHCPRTVFLALHVMVHLREIPQHLDKKIHSVITLCSSYGFIYVMHESAIGS